ncbi:hypothetical protein F5Y16DRAFT_422996 [Xylariaceae sp. FL0255]|nr:hypothetical protein F5Y16DRAFT_422996 [Xylariaceae sp. FL0255]
MFTPATTPYVSNLQVLCNTSPSSLTRALPNGVDADILLLGCGDVRDILYTAYCERGLPKRKLDITYCHIEPGIIARNIVLFSLLVDGVDVDTVFDIYFHLNIRKESHTKLRAQTERLATLMTSMNTWDNGAYGSFIKFSDEGSLNLVRGWIVKSAIAPVESTAETVLTQHLDRSKAFKSMIVDHSVVLAGLRSVAPLGGSLVNHIHETYDHWWKHGTFFTDSSSLPNPLFTKMLSENVILQYGQDPMLGFHLATAFEELAPSSPLRPNDKNQKGLQSIVETARVQFKSWTAAYKAACKNQIVMRFAIADALAFGHALQHAFAGSTSTANLFRCPQNSSPIILDPRAYGRGGKAPSRFDIIDSSNLIDHLGALNLLVATAPLLKDTAQSTLYLETLLKTAITSEAQFDNLLQWHTPVISLMLGLAPVEYWTSSTTISSIDEIILGFILTQGEKVQSLSKLSFKLAKHFLHQKPNFTIPRVEAIPLAIATFDIYCNMFPYEDPKDWMNMSREEIMRKGIVSSFPVYHRGGFVSLMKHMRTALSTDWPSFWKHLIQLVKQDDRCRRLLYFQELCVQLHVQGLYTADALTLEMETRLNLLALDTRDASYEEASVNVAGFNLVGFNTLENTPDVMCVTLEIPRHHANQLFPTETHKASAPTLQGAVEDSVSGSKSFFSCVQIIFGTVEKRPADDGKWMISISEDRSGWQGDSPLIAAFYVPTNVLFANPRSINISLGVQQTQVSLVTYAHLKGLNVYTAPLTGTSQVFVSRYLPGMSGYPVTCGHVSSIHADSTTKPPPIVGMDLSLKLDKGRIDEVFCHVDFSVGKGKELLEANKTHIEMQQSSPSTIEIVFKESPHIYSIVFPCPVSKEHAFMRIARTEGFIEVSAPVADPLRSDGLKLSAYPLILDGKGTPILQNGHQINLDSLPMLNWEESSKSQNVWLSRLTSNQFSISDRRIFETLEDGKPAVKTPRMKVRESLHRIFLAASGVEGDQISLFTLKHPELRNCLLLFVHTIRIDGAAASIVADAACLALTRDLVLSGELKNFMLSLRELKTCVLEVDDEEFQLWMRLIPAMAERCRTWSHKASCEYQKPGATIPLSTKLGAQFICSCGNGQIPDEYFKLPNWDIAVKHMVRVAITPIFPVPHLEPILDAEIASQFKLNASITLKKSNISRNASNEKCIMCDATENKEGGALLRCGRCGEVAYCSPECQKKDWKTHRQMECKMK